MYCLESLQYRYYYRYGTTTVQYYGTVLSFYI
eukprot:COSAG02_NODE_40936_length_395_cov_0.186047_1_plen_31_part_01